MARYVLSFCAKCKEQEMAEILGEGSTNQVVECGKCSLTYERPAPAKIKNTIKYPYMNHSLGEIVHSREHGDAIAKKMGLTPAEWGRVKRPKKNWKKTLDSKD